MITLKKRLSVVLGLITVLALSSSAVYASENVTNITDKATLEKSLVEGDIADNVNDSMIEYNYMDEYGNLVSFTEISTFATNSVLWNQSYTNQNSIKKEINARNYGPYANPGKVNVSIKNTGRTTIKVNIYQSWWNSKTLAYGTVAPGSSKTFTIGPQHGGYDCHGNSCFSYQKFTISVYADSGKISFNGYAKIFY